MTATLTPAYGRDYKSAKAVKEALASGADFVLNDMSSQWDGRYANVQSLREGGYRTVNVRYAGNRKVMVYNVPEVSNG